MLIKNKRSNKQSAVVLILAFVLIAFGAWGLWQHYLATHNPNPVISTKIVMHSTDEPDETPPNCDDSYTVSKNDPRKLELPSVNKSGCIQKVGIDQEKAVAVPTNVHVAGWYVGSARPGESGVSLIDGHVSGRYSEAVFTGLSKLKTGDPIRVQFGDKSWREFKVVDKQSLPAGEAGGVMLKQLDDIDKQLTLITCGGRFDRASQSYEDRVIIRSKLVE